MKKQTYIIPDYKVKEPKITIIERKLGREKAVGQSYKDDGLIEIDPRQDSFNYMETVIHEIMHVLFPALSETEITKKSHKLAKELWKIHFRRTHLK